MFSLGRDFLCHFPKFAQTLENACRDFGKVLYFELTRFSVFDHERNSRHLHHPSLGGAELRMACHPYPSECEGKMVSSVACPAIAPTARRRKPWRRRTKARRKTNFGIMFYTYILRSISHPDRRYIGSTSDLRKRLAVHNAGGVPHTAKFGPWKT